MSFRGFFEPRGRMFDCEECVGVVCVGYGMGMVYALVQHNGAVYGGELEGERREGKAGTGAFVCTLSFVPYFFVFFLLSFFFAFFFLSPALFALCDLALVY